MAERKYAKSVYVLGLDFGPEGKQAPLTVFTNHEEAEATRQLVSRYHGTTAYLEEVPFWPNVREDG